jgi:hypothetical protein
MMGVRPEPSLVRDRDELFAALSRSPFRSRFRLRGKELLYLRQHGIEAVLEHARRFIIERLAPAEPANDGKQTPMRNHPVFIAQHATATCCRGCLEKWHRISKGRPLSPPEIDYIMGVIEHWLRLQETL